MKKIKKINGVELNPGVTKIFSCKFVNANVDSVISSLIIADCEDEAYNKAMVMSLCDPIINDNYELVRISLHHSGFYNSVDDEEEMDPFDNITKEGYVLFDAESLR